MIKLKLHIFCELGEEICAAFRDMPAEEDVELTIEPICGAELPEIKEETAVLISGDQAALVRVLEQGWRIVPVGEAFSWMDPDSVLAIWPQAEGIQARREHFRELVRLLKYEHMAWEYRMLLEAAINTVPDLLWFKRLDGTHMLVNDAFAATVHKDKEMIHGQDHYAIWDAEPPAPDSGEAYDCSASEDMTIRAGKTCTFEETVETREGRKQLTTYKTPVFDDYGRVFGTVGVGHDVTNFTNLGIEILILIENLPVPIFLADKNWKVIQMNTGFMKIADIGMTEISSFPYQDWKKKRLISEGRSILDQDNHKVMQDFMMVQEGKTRHYLVVEQEIRDYFGDLSGYFCMMMDITVPKTYEQDMLRMATTDALTGLHNRRYFYSYLKENPSSLWTLLYLDLDGFKEVNDRFGHTRGDEVLVRTARLLQKHFPRALHIRLSGDEFAVLLEEEAQDDVLNKQIRSFEQEIGGLIPEMEGQLSVSVGIVRSRGRIKDIDEFLHEGDVKMYEVKRVHHEMHKKAFPAETAREKIDLFRQLFIQMEELRTSRDISSPPILKDVADFLRIGRLSLHFYENLEDEHLGVGHEKNLYSIDPDAIDESRFLERRNITRGYNIAYYRASQRTGEDSWTDEERRGVDFLLRMLFVFQGRLRLMEMADRLTFYDSEMDIHNLKYFMKAMGRLGQERKLGIYSIMRFNMKRFSAVNQQLGRRLGTRVMKGFVKNIEHELDGDEMICRVGGDNFIVLVDRLHEDDILDMLEESVITYDEEKGERICVGAYVGVYQIPDDGAIHTPTELMDKVSRAAQQAKASRDTSVAYYDAVMVADVERELEIMADFTKALDDEEFCVYYQPKVDLKTYKLVGAEALCRWRKDGKMVPPGAFIPLLERGMEICALDRYMLDHVCKDIRRWLDAGKEVVCVSVNLSRRNLADVDILSHILAVIDQNNVPHEYIEIELTETTSDSHFVDLRRIVSGLQEAGVKTAVDDFGIGYSSLTLIRDLPWDVLKIDRSFLPVEGEPEEKKKRLMFGSVVSMAQGLGMECIVEGVETKKQLQLLQENHCDQVQGFFFDRPMPVEEFERRMKRTNYQKIAEEP